MEVTIQELAIIVMLAIFSGSDWEEIARLYIRKKLGLDESDSDTTSLIEPSELENQPNNEETDESNPKQSTQPQG